MLESIGETSESRITRALGFNDVSDNFYLCGNRVRVSFLVLYSKCNCQKSVFPEIKFYTQQLRNAASTIIQRDEWPSGLHSLRQVTEVKLGRVRSNSGWVTSEN